MSQSESFWSRVSTEEIENARLRVELSYSDENPFESFSLEGVSEEAIRSARRMVEVNLARAGIYGARMVETMRKGDDTKGLVIAPREIVEDAAAANRMHVFMTRGEVAYVRPLEEAELANLHDNASARLTSGLHAYDA